MSRNFFEGVRTPDEESGRDRVNDVMERAGMARPPETGLLQGRGLGVTSSETAPSRRAEADQSANPGVDGGRGVRALPPANPLAPNVDPIREMTPWGVHLLSAARTKPHVTDAHLARFLASYMHTGHFELAAYHAGLMASQVRAEQEIDPEFKEAVEMARQMAAGRAEHEAHRRAIEGVVRDVRFQGIKVGEERVYSDALLGRILTAKVPEYTNKQEISGKIEHKVNWRELVIAVKDAQSNTDQIEG